jgi:glycosyltransferase involved in cell wall biosynthesis
MRVVLVEPYYGGSHRAWADGYAGSSVHDVHVIWHEARFWKWRMQGAFLTLAEQLEGDIRERGMPDVILASSMMDVAAFAGAIRNTAPGVPIAVFFHESQFTYPLSPADKPDSTYPMKNWSSAVAADVVIFNSVFHRDVFRTEAVRFLNAFPEYKHVDRVSSVIDESIVLPVGIDSTEIAGRSHTTLRPPLIVWNHRWEHDKGPVELLEIVSGLIESGVEFAMAMCGEVFVSVPPEFSDVIQLLGDRLVHSGWAERDRYIELLLGSSVVLSTSMQEFFGIGVVEAVAAGAHPVLPNRLVYPERVDALNGDPTGSLYSSPTHAVDLIVDAFQTPVDPGLARGATQYDWTHVAPLYDELLERL